MKKILIFSFLASGFVLNAQSFEILSQNGLYGIRQGKAIVIESTYDTIIKTYSKTRNLFIAKKSGSYGLIDEKENEIIPFKLDSIRYFCTEYGYRFGDGDAIYISPSCPENDYFIIYDAFWKKERLYCAATNLILNDWVDSLHYYKSADCFGYYADGKNYVVSSGEMKPLLNTVFRIENVQKYKNEFYFFVSDKGKAGIMDKTGKLIFPFKYDYLSMTTPDFIHYWNKVDKGIYGLTNLKQTYTLPVQYSYEWETINDFYLVSAFEKDSVFHSGITDRNGKTIMPFDKKDLPNANYLWIIGKRYVIIGKENIYLDLSKEKCEDSGFEEIGEGTMQSLGNNLVRIKKNGKYGIINVEGEIIMEPVFDDPAKLWIETANRFYYKR